MNNMKGQMFIVTVVFLAGTTTAVYYMLSSYSTMDASDALVANDVFVFENLKEVFNESVIKESECAKAEENINQLVEFLEGFRPFSQSFEIKVTTDCANWLNLIADGDPAPFKINITSKVSSEQGHILTNSEYCIWKEGLYSCDIGKGYPFACRFADTRIPENCNEDEYELFQIQADDGGTYSAHLAPAGQNYNHKVCCKVEDGTVIGVDFLDPSTYTDCADMHSNKGDFLISMENKAGGTYNAHAFDEQKTANDLCIFTNSEKRMISCSIKQSCASNEGTVIRIQDEAGTDYDNAHAADKDSDYNFAICCKATVTS